MTTSEPADKSWQSARTQTGETLGDLSRKSPVLVILLRHCGCTFAREALADVAARRDEITKSGAKIVVVHMRTEADAQALFAKYGLENTLRISDPEQHVYQAFEVSRGSFFRVIGPQIWGRAISAIFKGYGFAMPKEDPFQLPGAFLVHDGQIVNAFRGKNSSDRPDYVQMTQCAFNKAGS